MPELQLGDIERETLSPESARRWLGERSRVRQSLPQALTLHDRERGVPCRRRYGRDIPIFDCYLQAQAGALRAAFVRKALTGGAVRGDTVHSSVTPDDHASESEVKFAAERSSGNCRLFADVIFHRRSSSSGCTHAYAAISRRLPYSLFVLPVGSGSLFVEGACFLRRSTLDSVFLRVRSVDWSAERVPVPLPPVG